MFSAARSRFRMPGEFEAHEATWMLWPVRPDNWRDSAQPAQRAFAAVAAAIARFEPVVMGVGRRQLAVARAALPPSVAVEALASDDAWMRDVGPTVLVDPTGRRLGIDWRFNAWGGLYRPCERDNAVAGKVLARLGLARRRAPLICEGGAIHSDGRGTVMVTEQCLLRRNPRLARSRIERLLKQHLGARVILWLGEGVVSDETGGHVDNLACFARPGEVCLTWCDRRRDPQYRVSLDAYERLCSFRDAEGRRLRVHKLPMPGPLYMTRREAAGIARRSGIRPLRAGQRLAGSYVNFYLVNGGVIAPLLDARTDRGALARLRRIFPGRRVVGVAAREILLGGGNIHCITQQIPAARPAARRHTD